MHLGIYKTLSGNIRSVPQDMHWDKKNTCIYIAISNIYMKHETIRNAVLLQLVDYSNMCCR